MEYTLNTAHLRENPWIVIVGVGGTGAFVAEQVCRLMIGNQGHITLIDHDRVEPHNLLRQAFYAEDVGRHKSEAVAERLARQFDRPIQYSTGRIENVNRWSMGGGIGNPILVGCVDNAEARREMDSVAQHWRGCWIVDSGNGRDWGQVLVGNSWGPESMRCTFEDSYCNRVPAPVEQRPDLLTTVPDEPPDIDCAAAMDLLDQDPTINQTMASLTTHTVRRILAGTCNYMGLNVDLQQGTVFPNALNPQNVARVYAIDEKSLQGHDIKNGRCRNCGGYVRAWG